MGTRRVPNLLRLIMKHFCNPLVPRQLRVAIGVYFCKRRVVRITPVQLHPHLAHCHAEREVLGVHVVDIVVVELEHRYLRQVLLEFCSIENPICDAGKKSPDVRERR